MFAACFALALLPGLCFPQKSGTSPDQRLLTDLERRIERSDLSGVDQSLMNILIAKPDNIRALELLARLRSSQGRLSESRALYQRVLRLDPKATMAKVRAARIAYLLGNKDEGVQLLSAVDASGLDPTQRMQLSATYLLIGELQAALRIAESLPDGVRNTEGVPLLGEIYLRLNRLNEVKALVPLMRAGVAKGPLFAISCAEVLRGAGLYQEGISLLLSLPAASRNRVSVLLLLSRLEILSNNFAAARQHLASAARLHPKSADVLSLQAFVEHSSGSSEKALILITRARQTAPESPTVLADFVALTLRIGKPDLAYDSARTLYMQQPGNPEAQYLLGVAALQNGNLSAAREMLEPYVQSHLSDFRGCLALGTLYRLQRDTAKARSELARCNELDPANAEARTQLGLSYKSEGENPQAIDMFEQAVARAPNHPLAFRELGALYLESGDDVKARTMLERAAQIAPRDAETHFQLARLYNRVGETVLAKQHQEIFQKLRDERGKPAQ